MWTRRIRVAAVAGVAALVAGGGAALAARPSSPPELSSISPDRLAASVVEALTRDPSISGHVFLRLDLGVPEIVEGSLAELPGLAGLSGEHRLRLWRSPQGFRVTELLPAGERSLLLDRVGHSAWAWDSDSFTAYRLALGSTGHDDSPQPADHISPGEAGVGLAAADPLGVVRSALDAIAPSTRVRMGTGERVAGRDAYVLVVEPRTDETLVGRIELAVDAQRRLPLSVRLFSRGDDRAAVEVRFTDVRFDGVDPEVFRFFPPPGARVEMVAGPGHGGDRHGYFPKDIRRFGEGWTTVVAVLVPREAIRPDGQKEGGLGSLLPLSAKILSIRAVERGDHVWLVYGAVTQAALAAVEPRLP